MPLKRIYPKGKSHGNCKHNHCSRDENGNVTKTYRAWIGMKTRCYGTKRDKERRIYHERGITVCERWRNSFENFLADMGECPPGLTIDRIDNDKGYSPDNCRWATHKQQSRNLRTNHWIEYKGQKHILEDLPAIFGLPYSTIRHRLERGWTVEKALTTPLPEKKLIEFRGEKHLITEWERILGAKKGSIQTRIKKAGWTIEKALSTPIKKYNIN